MNMLAVHLRFGLGLGGLLALAVMQLGALLLAVGFVVALCDKPVDLLLTGLECMGWIPVAGTSGFVAGAAGSVILSRLAARRPIGE